ncbi:MAG: DUF5009 domain-containing protein [Citrobacter freundii]|nr:MAG: DUF5009 domain-containing protein [Citrobacter freundii]
MNAAIVQNKPAPGRLRSLDALRGFDMFWIVCGEFIFHGIAGAIKEQHGLVQRKTDWQIEMNDTLSFTERVFITISNQLHHTVWNGFTFYDLIFPLFIFIAGVSMPYSIGRKLENAVDKRAARKEIILSLLKRTIILILLGMVANGVLQLKGYEQTRFASVLGRIALSCFFAALIFIFFSLRGQFIWFIALLLGYWLLMILVPVPGYGSGVLTPEGNLAGYVDRLLLPGKLHRQVYDPEGLLSTVPAIGSALLGVFTGQFLKSDILKNEGSRRALFMALCAAGSLVIGALWGMVFPINKNMWTSSYVLFAGGWSLLLFAFFYFIIDVKGWIKWSLPFVWMGSNAILIYMAAHGLINFESTASFLFGGVVNRFPAIWHQALLWTGVAVIQFAMLYFLYRKKIFLKV